MHECHECGKEYSRIGVHWGRSQTCNHPQLTDDEYQMIIGLLMGDGWINKGGDNPYFEIEMTTKPFLEWLDEKMGIHTTGVKFKRSAEEMAEHMRNHDISETVVEENYHDIYRLQWRSNPVYEEFLDWYSTGNILFPDDIKLTPLMTKMWYACDGGLAWECGKIPTIRFSSMNEMENPNKIESYFDDAGFTARMSRHVISVSQTESKDFLNWLGEAPPGFEYKWEINSHTNYQKLMEKQYE